MRKVIFFATISFLLLSSFTLTGVQVVAPSLRNVKFPAGVSWQVDQESIQNDVTYFLCNGDIVFFSEIVIHEDLHGVENKNRFMVQGKVSFSGVGNSLISNEVYTLNDNLRINQHFPIINGATVINEKFK
jgi:hypothetical protein